MNDSLSVRKTVAELVTAYEQSVSDVRQAFGLLVASEERLNAIFTMDDVGRMHIEDRHGRTYSFGDPEDTIARLRLDVWRHLAERLELRRFLSVARANELDRMLDGKGEETFPEITIENVLGFANGFRSQIDSMLTEAVNEVFEFLRPHHSEYKRNSELEVPPRVVLRWMVERAWRGDGFRVEYRRQPQITALQNVFAALDGMGSIPKTHYGELYDAIDATGRDGRFETAYFRGRCFKNKNLHLEFKRADLLAKFNAIAGGKRLRPATEAA